MTVIIPSLLSYSVVCSHKDLFKIYEQNESRPGTTIHMTTL
jgi:hypothetical protein